MFLLDIAFLLVLIFVLIKASDQVVIAIKHLSHNTESKAFVISALLLAIATSFPELSLAITSSLEGSPHLSFGNILGANIANISLVAGLSALLIGKVNLHSDFISNEVGVALIAGLLPLVLALDGNVGRVDGLVLLAAYGAYATSFFKIRFFQIAQKVRSQTFVHRFFHNITHNNININKTKEWGRLFVGIAVLLFSANMIVKVAIQVSTTVNIPLFLVGLVVLSIGTTLPELAFSLRSLEDKEPTMYFGNLLGSIIANSTLILGIAALISPITVFARQEAFIASAAFVVIYVTFWFFVRSKLRLDRWEAGVLLVLYILFIVAEFL